MKRMILLLLLTLLLLTACDRQKEPAEVVQPVKFYYRTAKIDFSSEEGVIRAEIRDMGNTIYTEQDLFSLYFKGPVSEDLISPFTQDTELLEAHCIGNTLELRLQRNKNSPEEFDHSLTYACLAKTGLELDGINNVRITVSTKNGTVEDDFNLSENDILLYDNGDDPWNKLDITLYYSDENGSFLLPEKRSIPMMTPDELPQYVMNLLMSTPQSGGMKSALPPGTGLLDIGVEDGICSVDFNADFYSNRPDNEQAEQLAILSVVNTLCGLDGIDHVQFYSQGKKLDSYGWLDLSKPWMMDSAPVGPIRSELGEFSGTLYLPGQTDGLLHQLNVRARTRSGATREEALLLSLFARNSQNGLFVPTSGLPNPLSVSTSNYVCTVVLAENTLPVDLTSRDLAIRSITATLCTLSTVKSVTILDESLFSSSDSLEPASEWFCIPTKKLS